MERRYSALEEQQKRLEEERQREAERQQQQEAERREHGAQGYRGLQETHERVAHERQAEQEFVRQEQAITRENYDRAAAPPMRLDAPEITPEQVMGERSQSAGDQMQFTPMGTMHTVSHQQLARGRSQGDEHARQDQTREEIANDRAEVTDRRAETTDRQQAQDGADRGREMTDARARRLQEIDAMIEAGRERERDGEREQ